MAGRTRSARIPDQVHVPAHAGEHTDCWRVRELFRLRWLFVLFFVLFNADEQRRMANHKVICERSMRLYRGVAVIRSANGLRSKYICRVSSFSSADVRKRKSFRS